MTRSKAFFLNGGAGRMLCSIPALELYEQESGDKDFVIVCEGGTDMFKGHPTLDARAYDPWHKNLCLDLANPHLKPLSHLSFYNFNFLFYFIFEKMLI